MPQCLYVCPWDQLRDNRAVRVEVEGLELAVIRDGESIYAVSARCPHAGGRLSEGWLEDGELVCPLHRWRFRPRDGRCTTVLGESVRTFACERRGHEVWVVL